MELDPSGAMLAVGNIGEGTVSLVSLEVRVRSSRAWTGCTSPTT